MDQLYLAPKRTRRGTRAKGNEKHSPDKLKIYFNNINGFASKQGSLNQITKSISPDVIALCETKVSAKSNPKLNGYEPIVSNCKTGKEGFLVAIKEGTFMNAEKISESKEKNIVTVQVVYPECTMRFIVAHGPQENDEIDAKNEFYESLMVEIERGQASDDNVILLGDMNAKIQSNEADTEAIKDISANGKFLKELVDKYQLEVLNFHPSATGKWTRVKKNKKTTEKSVIDYVLVEENLKSRIEEVIIDEDKLYTPWRVVSRKKNRHIIFSDHTAIIATINIKRGMMAPEMPEQPTGWKLTDEGLTKYKELTSKRDAIVINQHGDSTDMYQNWMNQTEAIISQCFAKRKPRRKRNRPVSRGAAFIRKTLSAVAAQGKVQRELVKDYMHRLIAREVETLDKSRVEKLKQTIDSLTEEEKFSPNGFWKLKKRMARKSSSPKLNAILKGGVEITGKQLIKEEIRKEFDHRLRNREPADVWQDFVQTSNEIIEVLMGKITDNGPEFTLAELSQVIEELRKGKTPGYDGVNAELLLEAGEGLLAPLLKIFNAIRVSKDIPKQWNNVLISLIYKNKGSKKELVNYRGIFLTVIVSKVFESLLKKRMSTELKEVNLLQAGSRTNRSPADNTFLLRGCIDHQKYLGGCLYITAYDFEQAFDSLWLQDCVLSLKSLNVPDYILQLIQNMNQKANVIIKTPHGRTTPLTVHDIVKQGGVLGSPMCSASTAEYCGTSKGVCMGTLLIDSLVFVDDMLDVSLSWGDAHKSHENSVIFSFKKKMNHKGKKCKSLVANKKKKNLLPNLMIGDEATENASVIEYLGDIFNAKGDNSDMIKDRVRRGIAAIVSIEAIMSDLQLGTFTVSVYLLLYHSLFLSTMLFNSQAWSNLSKKDIDSLQVCQLKMLKKILGGARSMSNAFTFLELGVLPISYEIHKRQLSFLHHILNLKDDDPVKTMYLNMKQLPGEKNWCNCVGELLRTYNISLSEEEIKTKTKGSFKRMIKKAITQTALTNLQEEISNQKKTSSLIYTKLKTQDYLTKLFPWQSKLVSRTRSKTLDIKTHQKFKYKDSLCRWCNLDDETLSHIINCGEDPIELVDLNNTEEMDSSMITKISRITYRIQEFLEKVDY